MTRYATGRELIVFSLLSTSFGLTLAFGMLSFVTRVALVLGIPQYEEALFPMIAFGFYWSLKEKTPWIAPYSVTKRRWVHRAILPMMISCLFGAFLAGPSIIDGATLRMLLWPVILSPIGEEFLFRGWVYSLGERLFPKTLLTMANPFPVSVWLSAVAFSLWHLQNPVGIGLVTFQMGYTFIVGLWFGAWRWHSGSIVGPVVAHIGLNFFSVLV